RRCVRSRNELRSKRKRDGADGFALSSAHCAGAGGGVFAGAKQARAGGTRASDRAGAARGVADAIRRGQHRTTLPPAGRNRHALLRHHRLRDPGRRQRHRAVARFDAPGTRLGRPFGRASQGATGEERMTTRTATAKYVFFFDEGDASMKNLLGGKGAGLAEMTSAGLPVPSGFTISTEACLAFYDSGRRFPEGLPAQIGAAMHELEKRTGKEFGSVENPLLVSVRSGARVSMPGMMDTILNLGLNDQTVETLAALTNNPRFAWDAYRRFITMFSSVVLGVSKDHFEERLDDLKASLGVKSDPQVDAESWKKLVAEYERIVLEATGRAFPQDVREQLDLAIAAVFDSWHSKRASDYRRFNRIPDDWGTAVTVMEMVFGNLGDDSGTGVAFTRDPNTGEAALFGEYLVNAQGEDVVAGIRTPEKIADLAKSQPKVFAHFQEIATRLERHYRDMQDLEFTVERGKLFMLQTRNGKRSAEAAVKIALDLVREGLID